MSDQPANQSQRVEVLATITRADGTVEDLGVIATNDPNGPGDVRVHPPAEEPHDGRA